MDHTAVVIPDLPGDEIEARTQRPVGAVLVLAGEATVAGHVRIQDGGELAWQTFRHTLTVNGLDTSDDTIAGSPARRDPAHRRSWGSCWMALTH